MSRILAAHSQVEGTRELSELQRIVLEIGGKRSHPGEPVLPGAKETSYPGMLTELAPEDLRALGERYITDTRASRRHKPFFTDNMPNKFRHIGLIHLMLPKAKIIDVRREPMASCFSNLKELFGRGQEFTYSIGDISRYSDLSRADATLGRGTSRADTASLVPGRRGRSRGKPGAHPRLLRSWIRTGLRRVLLQDRTCCPDCKLRAGSPAIFREGLFQWKNYEPWRGPLKDSLGEH